MRETTNAENVIRALKLARSRFDGGWCTIGFFLEMGTGTRYGGRIMELRAKGYEIERKRFGVTGPGDYRYRLVREPGDPKPEKKVETALGFVV